ncbi:MAG: DUF4755 domain-containing protein [Acetobacter orientalis]|uniref:DUF4755 domain-containing protein n=1 Tax=Acetobacter orientalis TaxID=146474 RepID=UPI0039E8B01F
MIVINKPFDGVPVKGSKRDFILRLFVKPPLVVFLLFSLAALKSGIGAIVYAIFPALLSIPIFFIFYSLYVVTFQSFVLGRKFAKLSRAEIPAIKKYLVDTYKKPLIYFDFSTALMEAVSLSWSKAVLYPTFIAFNGYDFFMTNRQGQMVKFNWEDVRQWSNGTQTGGNFVNANLDLSAQVHNIQQKGENAKASGFFVTIKDVNQPKWQFTTTDEALQNKWMEVFRQVKDGTIKLQS